MRIYRMRQPIPEITDLNETERGALVKQLYKRAQLTDLKLCILHCYFYTGMTGPEIARHVYGRADLGAVKTVHSHIWQSINKFRRVLNEN